MSAPPLSYGPLRENLSGVRARIDRAAEAAGRRPSEIQILPVTKSVDAALAAELLRLGCADLGEARVDALEAKATALETLGLGPRWHFIGHLQRNKARRVVRLADVIHSVDSVRLLDAIARLAGEEDRRVAVYLQVNFTGEPEKAGMDDAGARAALERSLDLASLDVLGLMAMGPRSGDREATRAVFQRTADLARELERGPLGHAFVGGRCRLSMGMSGDIEEAVAAGSDLVRVGGALFHGLDLDSGATG